MRRGLTRVVAGATILLCCVVAPAQAEFGFADASLSFREADGSLTTRAGSHPYAVEIEIDPETEVDPELGEVPVGQPRELWTWLPPGLVGSPDVTPRCAATDFLTPVVLLEGLILPDCSDSSVLGLARVRVGVGDEQVEVATPIYNLLPSPGELARLGLRAGPAGPIAVSVWLSEFAPSELVAGAFDIPASERFLGASMTLWGAPSSYLHDEDRGGCGASLTPAEGGTTELGGSCPTSNRNLPFLTLPRSCTGPLAAFFAAESWLEELASAQALTHDDADEPLGIGGCNWLTFAPVLKAKPTTLEAGSPSGFDLDLGFFDEGLDNVNGLAGSDLREIEIALPPETTLHPAGLAARETCSEADFARETSNSTPGEGCPAASKIGSVAVKTPLLEGVLLRGSLFLGEPYAEPFDTLYLTIKEPQRGIEIDVWGEVEKDPESDRLTIVFYDLPQLPFSSFHLVQDPPLFVTPLCGDYKIETFLTPSADPSSSYRIPSPFKLEQGPGGSPCPAGAPPTEPKQENPPLDPGDPIADPPPRPGCGAHARKAKRLARRAGRLRRAARQARAPKRHARLRRKSRRLAKRASRESRAAKRCWMRISQEAPIANN